MKRGSSKRKGDMKIKKIKNLWEDLRGWGMEKKVWKENLVIDKKCRERLNNY